MEENATTQKPNTKDPFFGLSKISFWKEHVSLIVLVPYMIGGFWQLCELAIIKLAYVRFFSFSQSIADGLLILFVVLLFLLARHIFYSQDKIANYLKVITKTSNVIDVKTHAMLLTYGLAIIVLFPILIAFKWILTINWGTFAGFLVLGFFVFIGIRGIKERPNQKIKDIGLAKSIGNKAINNIRFALVIALITIISISCYNIVQLARTSFTFPQNNKNFLILRDQIEAEVSADTAKVIYFNDNYIFWEYSDSISRGNIYISDFSELTSKNPK
ncbi:MAG: hypothetical protein HYZ43_05765 [Flavobacteriia bacterium]|nr:hypothetical protein [Flavobacteriia bacterium]